jgi:hypothetical protein
LKDVKGLVFPAFGLGVELGFSLPPIEGRGVAGCRPTLRVRLVPFEQKALAAGPEELVWATRFDGHAYAMYRQGDGSHRFVYGDRAVFHLSSDGRDLRCAVADVDDPAWQRLFLDTVLWSCSLLNGFELLHASAVAWPHGAVALASTTGGGKTSLAAELVRRGAELLCDDVLAFTRVDGRLGGHPGPPVMNLPRGGPREIGRKLARFPDEHWIAVERAAREPRPLEAICLLARRPGAALVLERLESTALDLLPHAFAVRGVLGRRAAHRFEVLSQVATEVPVYRLSADVDVPVWELADLVESSLCAPTPARAVA